MSDLAFLIGPITLDLEIVGDDTALMARLGGGSSSIDSKASKAARQQGSNATRLRFA